MEAIWDSPDFDGHEAVHIMCDRDAGLTAIIALHSTALGPAAGGTRYWRYVNGGDAITDALRLSRGMSYKNAMAGLPMGGGKAVIVADHGGPKTDAVLAAFARAVDQLGGRYVTAQDVGMSEADMIAIAAHTPYVAGLPPKPGAAGGDPGPSTALGVFLGVAAAARVALGADRLTGVHVAVQGLGSVGGGVARRLARAGARLTLADADPQRARALARELGAAIVDPGDIMRVPADIFCPCALGAILDQASIAGLAVKAVAGGANNQLARAADGDALHDRGILFAPDYVINAGGIINVTLAYLGTGDAEAVEAKVREIPARLETIWAQSKASGVAPARVADDMSRRLIGR